MTASPRKLGPFGLRPIATPENSWCSTTAGQPLAHAHATLLRSPPTAHPSPETNYSRHWLTIVSDGMSACPRRCSFETPATIPCNQCPMLACLSRYRLTPRYQQHTPTHSHQHPAAECCTTSLLRSSPGVHGQFSGTGRHALTCRCVCLQHRPRRRFRLASPIATQRAQST